MARLWVALSRAYRVLGFETATGDDEAPRALVLARVIEPTRKLDSLRVIEEARGRPSVVSGQGRRIWCTTTCSPWSRSNSGRCAAGSAWLTIQRVLSERPPTMYR
jgi:hypothetical protein